jgi:alkanesulfonate monooxygenase SsuD/methylene tetrahydromethanopterin reductase-like flavin-dependent oxidoreductase (luciferase family)
MLRVGITLPTFTDDPSRPLRAAKAAESAGLSGVFAFDHLWPLGQPARPALHGLTTLGAIATATERVAVGPLVARVGLLPDVVLVNMLRSLDVVSGGRLLAALGTGDSGNRDENAAYGVPFEPARMRLDRLRRCLGDLRACGVQTWAGGRSPMLRDAAAEAADALNVWGATPAQTAAEGADVRRRAGERSIGITWAGQVLIGRDEDAAADILARHGTRPGLVHGTPADLAAHFVALVDAGAEWAVCAPLDHDAPDAMELIAHAASIASGTLESRQ